MTRQKFKWFLTIPSQVALAFALCLFLAGAAHAGTLKKAVFETQNGPAAFRIEVMRSPEERARGLMFRESIADDYGMLFDFESSYPVRMWMKNTLIALDMIFIREDGTVAGIAHNTEPMSEAIIASPEPVRFVLEVSAGVARARGISPGDKATLPVDR